MTANPVAKKPDVPIASASRPELRADHDARHPLNSPASMPYCFILRYRVL
jgi:hypothetical protein